MLRGDGRIESKARFEFLREIGFDFWAPTLIGFRGRNPKQRVLGFGG